MIVDNFVLDMLFIFGGVFSIAGIISCIYAFILSRFS